MIDVPVKRNLDENIPVSKMLGGKLELLCYDLRNFHGLREHPWKQLSLSHLRMEHGLANSKILPFKIQTIIVCYPNHWTWYTILQQPQQKNVTLGSINRSNVTGILLSKIEEIKFILQVLLAYPVSHILELKVYRGPHQPHLYLCKLMVPHGLLFII